MHRKYLEGVLVFYPIAVVVVLVQAYLIFQASLGYTNLMDGKWQAGHGAS
jgi:hypothetical protein